MTVPSITLVEQFIAEAKRAGSLVYQAKSNGEVVNYIMGIVRKYDLKSVVKSKSLLANRIGLRQQFQSQGLDVKETDIGEWITQLFGETNNQKSLDGIAQVLSKEAGRDLNPDPEKLVEISRLILREYCINADIGISEAEIGVAETGTCILASNEGNDRLVSLLPKIHITLINERSIFATWEEAINTLRQLYKNKDEWKMPSFITYLTGRNTTGDIPGALMARAQGPEEEHIILTNVS